MDEERSEGHNRRYILMRSLMDAGMGIIYIGVAIFILFTKEFGFSSAALDPPFSYFFGGICIIYGGFRIYRAVKKNYFRS